MNANVLDFHLFLQSSLNNSNLYNSQGNRKEIQLGGQADLDLS